MQGLSNQPEIIAQVPDQSVDLVIVDGDHTRYGVISDFRNFWPKLRLGGLMVIDDFGNDDWPEVETAVKDLLASSEDLTVVWDSQFTLGLRKLK